jgi:signal peptidase I
MNVNINFKGLIMEEHSDIPSKSSEVCNEKSREPVGKAIRKKSVVREYAESIIIAILLALVIRTYLVQAFKIPSGSMEDTLAIGDHLLVNKFIFGTKIPFTATSVIKLRDPRQGDVIVFEYPEDPSKDFIKRVIGVPGDVVEGKSKIVFVNGKPYENPHEIHKEKDIIPREMNPRDTFGPVTVPANSYFMMGDNRDRSYDSRFWGFVSRDKIKGLAFIKYWSWDREKIRPRFGSIGRLIN